MPTTTEYSGCTDCCGPPTCSNCTGVPASLTVDLTSNCFGDVTITITDGTGDLWSGSNTSTNGDDIDVELDMDACEFRISCNGSLQSVVDISAMIVTCDPFEVALDPPVTFIAGCCTGPIPSPRWSGTITE